MAKRGRGETDTEAALTRYEDMKLCCEVHVCFPPRSSLRHIVGHGPDGKRRRLRHAFCHPSPGLRISQIQRRVMTTRGAAWARLRYRTTSDDLPETIWIEIDDDERSVSLCYRNESSSETLAHAPFTGLLALFRCLRFARSVGAGRPPIRHVSMGASELSEREEA